MNKIDNKSRRSFLRSSTYVIPAVLTLNAIPALASQGSKQKCNNGVGNGSDCLPPGLQKNGKDYLDNDDNGGIPGNPQNKGGNK